MTKRERAKLRRQRKVRRFVLTIALMALVAVIAIGGTVAWLTANTDPVTNTFTAGDINIELKENTGNSYKIIPGVDIDKDPTVTVKAGSEACWLFVKVVEANWPTPEEEVGGSTVRKVNYAIADGWNVVPGEPNVYYRDPPATGANDATFDVLKDNKVTVSQNLTKTEVEAIGKDASAPTLTFTAYACQKEKFDNVEAAWNVVKPAPVTPPESEE